MKLNQPFRIKELGFFVFLIVLPCLAHARNTFHYNDPKTGVVTILTDQKDSACESGYLYAFNGTFTLKKWYPKTNLCYKVDSNKRLVMLRDPAKWMFGSYKIPADYFSYIPSDQEKAAQEDAERRANFARNIEQWNRSNAQTLNRLQTQENGIQTLMLNGDLKTCIRTGPMLDCD